ncbi:MAG: CapA family protein [Lachnospiraceae bacterium]|nr:CapA family protein [Lachnospiraceae bacterium]
MCLRGQQYDAKTKKGYNFLPSYRFVSRIFNNADLVCGNLETLVSPSNPLTKDRKTDDNGTPVCNAPSGLLCALKKAGFDMLLTAHNHCCDYGADGIIETKENLDRYHFANAGTAYPGEQAGTGGNYCIFEVNGINIAILTYTHLINQRSLMSHEELDTMVNRYDSERVGRDIADARAAGAEFVVVYCHWGIENTEELTEYQIRDAEKTAEAGADLIIGSHPHCLQPGRFIETSDGRTVFCIYSMGNFCSSMERDINNDTIILRLELARAADGSVTSALSYIPCRVTHYRSHSFVVVPTDSELNGGISDRRLREADERIGEVLEKTEGGMLPRY